MDFPVVAQMQAHIDKWAETADSRSVFLSCYQMMTQNMLLAIEQQEFIDPVWVDRLLHRFAEYYFLALEAYERDPTNAPRVWQLAHDLTREPGIYALQKLMLGVNAHINYDLVLALVDLLRPEWASLSESQRSSRYFDHCHVNDIIARTIDAVQDQVIEPAMPFMDLIDKMLGRIDESFVSGMITRWRELVWQNAVRLLETLDPDEQARLVKEIEKETLIIGSVIGRKKLDDLMSSF